MVHNFDLSQYGWWSLSLFEKHLTAYFLYGKVALSLLFLISVLWESTLKLFKYPVPQIVNLSYQYGLFGFLFYWMSCSQLLSLFIFMLKMSPVWRVVVSSSWLLCFCEQWPIIPWAYLCFLKNKTRCFKLIVYFSPVDLELVISLS